MLPRTSPNTDHNYIPRYIDQHIDDMLTELGAIAIDGPKGVGKTETATRHSDVVLRLDVPSTRQLLANRPVETLSQAKVVCVDEWQRYPQVWDDVRRLVDDHTPTKFILTGSASPQEGVDTHSGAGRIISLRLRPLSLAERASTTPSISLLSLFDENPTIDGTSAFTLDAYAREICSSGLPGFQGLTPRQRRNALHSYAQRIIDRDVAEMGVQVRRPQAMRAWMTAYAAATSTTSTYSTIRDAATPNVGDKPSRDSTSAYRELLTKIWVLDPVPAWLPALTPLKRLTSGEKHQLCDPGLAAYLLGLSEEQLLSGAPGTGEMFGQLFEALATLTLRCAAEAAEAQIFHLRTQGGRHEIDLIAQRYDGTVVAFEVKLARTVSDSDVKHLHWLGESLGSQLKQKVLIYAGQHAYRRKDGVAVIPLDLLH